MQVITIFGSNQGDKYQILTEAIQMLSSAGQVLMASSFYETEPWGFECEEHFLNRVIVYDTPLSPADFLAACLYTEQQFGRQRNINGPRYASRPIDIDILFYDSLILGTPDLTIPHPRIPERNFVLTPLHEILPDFVHPVSHKTISELLAACPDTLQVKKIVIPGDKLY